MSLLTFFEWLQYSSLLSAMRGSPWIFPLIASIHLMGLALIGGSVLLVDLRLLGLGMRHQPLAQVSARLRTVAAGKSRDPFADRRPSIHVFRRDEVLLYEGLLGKDGRVGSGPALHFCRPSQSGHGRRDAHEFHLEQTRRGRFARTLGHRSSCGTMDRITVEDRGSNPERMRFRPSFS